MNEQNMTQEVKNFRINHLLTQAELADLIGCSKSAVSMMETGAYKWTDLTAAKLRQKMKEIEERITNERQGSGR